MLEYIESILSYWIWSRLSISHVNNVEIERGASTAQVELGHAVVLEECCKENVMVII